MEATRRQDDESPAVLRKGGLGNPIRRSAGSKDSYPPEMPTRPTRTESELLSLCRYDGSSKKLVLENQKYMAQNEILKAVTKYADKSPVNELVLRGLNGLHQFDTSEMDKKFLENLTVLEIRDCHQMNMKETRFDISDMKKLKELRVTSNRPKTEMPFMETAKLVNITVGGIKKFAKKDLNLPELTHFEFMRCHLRELPKVIVAPNLVTFNVAHNYLRNGTLPEKISAPNATELDLSWNYMDLLPDFFDGMPNLETVDLRACSKITELPSSFYRLRKLKDLYISFNSFRDGKSPFIKYLNDEMNCTVHETNYFGWDTMVYAPGCYPAKPSEIPRKISSDSAPSRKGKSSDPETEPLMGSGDNEGSEHGSGKV